MTKEELLKEIEKLACDVIVTQRMYFECPVQETSRIKNLRISVENDINTLEIKTKEFLEKFPEISKEKLDKFILNIQAYESLIFYENKKIEKYQQKKFELAHTFLN